MVSNFFFFLKPRTYDGNLFTISGTQKVTLGSAPFEILISDPGS